jgi:hypothetical protein
MSSSARRSTRRSTVASTLSSSPTAAARPAPIVQPTTPTVQPPTPTKTASTEIIKEATLANCPLYLECEDEGLTSPQKTFHNKKVKDFQVKLLSKLLNGESTPNNRLNKAF